MPRLIANKQLTGRYGTVVAGQEFDATDDEARFLLQGNAVRKPVVIRYETKVVRPESSFVLPEAPQVSARQPFRDSAVPDTQSPGVASAGDSEFPEADVPEPGNVNRRGRPRRQ